ncbi:MAG: S1 family peptidase, partial [Bdellovibrionales bacterium]
MKIFSLLIVLMVLNACTPPSATQDFVDAEGQDSITSGKAVAKDNPQFNSVVGIRMIIPGADFSGICTGTLIQEDVVLTAAHCLKDEEKEYSEIFVIFNTDVRGVPKQFARRAVRGIIHHSFVDGRNSNSHDIALLKFTGGLPAGYKPSPLMRPTMELRRNDKITVAGYGINSVIKNKGSGILRFAEVRIADPDTTQTEFRVSQWLRGVCMGDSGGPAFKTINGVQYVVG